MDKQNIAVLWDMDGTIIDTEPAWVAAEEELLKEFGAEFEEADAQNWVGIGLWELASQIQSRGVDLSADEIVAKLSTNVSERIFSGNLVWRPGAQELLAGFRKLGVTNALVTMATRSQALQIISHLPDGTFKTVTAGDDVENPKPHPDPYLQGARSLGLSADKCIAIEDSINGVRSAAAAGTFVIAVPNLVDLTDSPYSVLVDSLASVTAQDILDMFKAHTNQFIGH